MLRKSPNRKMKKLNKFLHYTVRVKLNDFQTYTGILVPSLPDSYCIIYEENDNEKVKFFYAYQLLEMWTFYKGQIRKVFSVKEDD